MTTQPTNNMYSLLRDIESDLSNIKSETHTFHPFDHISASGKTWKFQLVSFSIVDQGFPAGSLGYDGTAIKNGTIVRLTPELAKKAYEFAARSER